MEKNVIAAFLPVDDISIIFRRIFVENCVSSGNLIASRTFLPTKISKPIF